MRSSRSPLAPYNSAPAGFPGFFSLKLSPPQPLCGILSPRPLSCGFVESKTTPVSASCGRDWAPASPSPSPIELEISEAAARLLLLRVPRSGDAATAQPKPAAACKGRKGSKSRSPVMGTPPIVNKNGRSRSRNGQGTPRRGRPSSSNGGGGGRRTRINSATARELMTPATPTTPATLGSNRVTPPPESGSSKKRSGKLGVESQNKRPRSTSSVSSIASTDGVRSPPMAVLRECAADVARTGAGAGAGAGADVAAGSSGAPHAFQIKGTQGQLNVCEYRKIKNGAVDRPYMLVRLRGQSNTLPNDASLSVMLPGLRAEQTIDVHLARVRLKAGELRYDYLPKPTQLARVAASGTPGMTAYQAPLLSSIFSKKCWQGMVVRGPRMFVAFIKGQGPSGMGEHSVPMFVEISPTSNSPEYRDPVLEYSPDVIRLFFAPETVTSVFAGAK